MKFFKFVVIYVVTGINVYAQSYVDVFKKLQKINYKVHADSIIPIFRELENYAEFQFQKNTCYLNFALLYKSLNKQDSVIFYINKIEHFDLASKHHFSRLQFNSDDLIEFSNFSNKDLALIKTKHETSIEPKKYSNFDEIKFHFEDIERFWYAFDHGVLDSLNREKYIREYLNKLSNPAMQFFASGISDTKFFSKYIFERRGFFHSVRKQTLSLDSIFYDKLKVALDKAKPYFNNACYADIYFTISDYNNSVGIFENGVIIIPINFFCLKNTTECSDLSFGERLLTKSMDYLAAGIIHVLVHPNQSLFSDGRILDECIREGMADYIADYFTGNYLKDFVATWTNGNTRKLWDEFRPVMLKMEDSSFVPNSIMEVSENRSIFIPDYFGYQICKVLAGIHGNGIRKLLHSKSAGKILVDSYWENYLKKN